MTVTQHHTIRTRAISATLLVCALFAFCNSTPAGADVLVKVTQAEIESAREAVRTAGPGLKPITGSQLGIPYVVCGAKLKFAECLDETMTRFHDYALWYAIYFPMYKDSLLLGEVYAMPNEETGKWAVGQSRPGHPIDEIRRAYLVADGYDVEYLSIDELGHFYVVSQVGKVVAMSAASPGACHVLWANRSGTYHLEFVPFGAAADRIKDAYYRRQAAMSEGPRVDGLYSSFLVAPPGVRMAVEKFLKGHWVNLVNRYGSKYLKEFRIENRRAAISAESGNPFPVYRLDFQELQGEGLSAMKLLRYVVPVRVDGRTTLVCYVAPDSSEIGYTVFNKVAISRLRRPLVSKIIEPQLPDALPFELVIDNRLNLMGGVSGGEMHFATVDEWTAIALSLATDGTARSAAAMTDDFDRYVRFRKREGAELDAYRQSGRHLVKRKLLELSESDDAARVFLDTTGQLTDAQVGASFTIHFARREFADHLDDELTSLPGYLLDYFLCYPVHGGAGQIGTLTVHTDELTGQQKVVPRVHWQDEQIADARTEFPKSLGYGVNILGIDEIGEFIVVTNEKRVVAVSAEGLTGATTLGFRYEEPYHMKFLPFTYAARKIKETYETRIGLRAPSTRKSGEFTVPEGATARAVAFFGSDAWKPLIQSTSNGLTNEELTTVTLGAGICEYMLREEDLEAFVTLSQGGPDVFASTTWYTFLMTTEEKHVGTIVIGENRKDDGSKYQEGEDEFSIVMLRPPGNAIDGPIVNLLKLYPKSEGYRLAIVRFTGLKLQGSKIIASGPDDALHEVVGKELHPIDQLREKVRSALVR